MSAEFSIALKERASAASDLVARVARAHPPAVFATSLGAEDMVLLDLIADAAPTIRVVSLDTGRLPQETHDLIDRTRDRYRLPIEVRLPDAQVVEQFVAEHGTNAFYRSLELRKRCCELRKTQPLRSALKGAGAWITGLRRAQGVTRGDVRVESFDTGFGLPKFAPLADWSNGDVWDYLRIRQVPWNTLHDRGYPSIGCAPCTRAVQPGEDVRAGRWWWEQPQHKECGLHRRPDGSAGRANVVADPPPRALAEEER